MSETTVDAELMVQPHTLDIAFHGVMATWFFPGDGRFWRLMLPRSIKKITVNPSLRANKSTSEECEVHWSSTLTDERPGEITGNVDIFASEDSPAVVQVDGLKLTAFQGNTAADDRLFYSTIVWDTASPDTEAAGGEEEASPYELELGTACERVAFYSWHTLDWEKSSSENRYSHILETVTRNLSLAKLGKHPTARKEWAHDTKDEIMALVKKYPESIDMKLLRDVAEYLPAEIAGHQSLAEQVTQHGMLEQFYKLGFGVSHHNNDIGRLARQMTHRYPHMNILEIGGGTGSLATAVLEHLRGTFNSYTFTDKSIAAVENAQKRFTRQLKITFQPLDIEYDPISQGFSKSSYDLIIAPMTLHTTADLGQVLIHLRSLTRPGGQLLLQVLSDSGTMRFASFLGYLPEYWSGTDDSRSLTSRMSASKWNSKLRNSGFSGVDTMIPDRDTLASPLLVLGTQAVNEQINYLRRPLLQTNLPQVEDEDLYIIGGDTITTSRVVEELTSILRSRCSKIISISKVDDINATDLPAGSTVISLAELDEPLFKNLSPTRWKSMKQLFDRPRQMLWLTRGRMGDEPYSSMTIGFWRSVAYEAPHVRVQFLDIDPRGSLDPSVIAETFLRTAALNLWGKEGQASSLLWSRESELLLQNGKLLIPRAMPQQACNDRLNAGRRDIQKDVAPARAAVQIERLKDTYRFREISAFQSQDSTEQLVDVQIKYSLLSAIKAVPVASLYLGFGIIAETREEVLALSQSNASLVNVPKDWTTPCSVPRGEETSLLLTVAGELLVTVIMTAIPTGGLLLVHEPHPFIASILNVHASKRNIRVVFVTGNTNHDDPQWTCIHPRASRHAIAKALPANVSTFVDLSYGSTTHGFGNRIATALPDNCKQEKTSTLFSPNSKMFADSSLVQIPELLGHAAWISQCTLPSFVRSLLPDAISPHEVLSGHAALTPFSILDWNSPHPVPVTVEAINPRSLFSKAKTYFLIGLTGEIGRSVTQWMAENGAGYIAMTSRNPNVDPNWLKSVEATGATVKVYAMDVANRESLQSVYDEISRTLPPIAGVANAAMVLRDQLFANMDLETMEQVLRPKVDGTNNLDELFEDKPLDFFVLFSSLACVIGNDGQSNYSAANMYMTALAAQRKKNGLAASVMDIGRVVGVGYLGRANTAVDERLAKYGMMAVSETDLHHQFAEAVMAGRPGSKKVSELISGLATVEGDEDDENKMRWAANPIFSHYVVQNKQTESRIESGQGKASLKGQLEVVQSETEALNVLQSCFALKMQNILQLAPDGIDKDVPLVEFGVDSLVAVEVRTWFLKELETDMPVLKILGGASVADLCRVALEKLPKDLLPVLGVNKLAGSPRPRSGREQIQVSAMKGTEQASALLRNFPKTADTDDSSSFSTSPSFTAQSPSDRDSSESINASSLSDCEEDLETGEKTTTGTKTISSWPTFQKVERQSLSQSRFWFLRRYVKNQATFNVTFYHRVTGDLNMARLAQAIEILGSYHETLRTAFFAENDHMDSPMQGVMEKSTLHLEHRKISSNEQAIAEYERMKDHVFDVEKGETMRILLLSRSSTDHFVVFGHPHILMDGVSFQVFLNDLEKVYNGQVLSSGTLQYADFSARQREEVKNGSMGDEVAFWRKEYPDMPQVLPLFPMTKSSSRKVLAEYNTNSSLIRLDKDLAIRIRTTCIKHQVTSFHFYLAAFRVLLFRFLDTEDLSIGIADANRNDSATLRSIGLYLNLLPLRFRATPNATFSDALREARTKSYSALEHSRLPFDIILDLLNVPRSASHSPLFQAFFDYRQGAKENLSFSNVQFQIQDAALGQTAYDISLDVTESSAGPLIMMKAQDYLYSKSTTEKILKSYINLLEAFSTNANLTHKVPSLFKESDLELALQLGRGPPMQSTWPETLAHRVDEMIASCGNRLALKDGSGKTLSYTQMAQRVDSIAAEMINKDVTPGSRVAVFQEPTADWICSLLAILRIGAVYVPLDLRNPISRLAAMIKASKAAAILAQAATIQNVPELGTSSMTIIDVSKLADSTTSNILNQAKADALAVTLFTSGSTGTPKGILLSHRTLLNEIEGYTKIYNIGAETILQQSAFSFDFSMDQIFTALANGGTLIVVPKIKRGDSVAITDIIREEQVTYTKATPSEYSNWIEHGADSLKKTSKWKFAFGGGELLTNQLLREFHSLQLTQLRLFNSYGPAEASIASTKIEVRYNSQHDVNEPIPAGFALPNYSLYIVDKHLNLVPMGMPGQIAIGGAAPGLGYLNDDTMTAQKFVRNPFASDRDVTNGWTTMYLTGDKGRLRDDGALLFDGRIEGDTQIKLRGLRIDLKDIESTIVEASRGHLVSAIVTVRGTPQFLVAHVVFSPTFDFDDRDGFLRQLLSSLPLPSYMIPAIAVPLESMPLNTHSKVDRIAVKNLPLPKASQAEDSNVELTNIELQLKLAWERTVSRDITTFRTINSSTNFFHIGGNSLLLVKLQSMIRDTFNVALPLVSLFDNSTLSEMACMIRDSASVSTLDWEEETSVYRGALENDAVISSVDRSSHPKAAGRTVVLTGATGYLGRYLLRQLDADVSISKIVCIAVRPTDDGRARELPVSSTKVASYVGDLTAPLLGLSHSDFANLAGETDTIIHCGGRRSFWDSYHQLRKVNFVATREIVKLAFPRRIPIHFTSSAGVMHLAGSAELKAGAASMSAYPPPTDGSDGYVASKWASEKYLENACHELDIPVTINRFVPADHKTAAPLEILQEFIKYANAMHTLPSQDGWDGDFDLLPVHNVATSICNATNPTVSPTMFGASGDVRFTHYKSEMKISVKEAFGFLAVNTGKEGMTTLPTLKWIGEIKKMGFKYLFASHDVAFHKKGDGSAPLVSRR